MRLLICCLSRQKVTYVTDWEIDLEVNSGLSIRHTVHHALATILVVLFVL